MTAARRTLLVLAALIGILLPASAAPASITGASRLDLANKTEWCDSADQMDVTAVAAGACRFAPASTLDLKRGLTKQTIWLRLSLINPADTPAERWLQIGHPRLTHVTFFERLTGGWRQSKAGTAVPLAKRDVRTIDPILPLTLAPYERRTVLVRIASISTIDVAPVLWRPNAYNAKIQTEVLYSGIGIGTLIASAIFILSIAFLWKARAYFYLCIFIFAIIAFSTSRSGQMQFYFWPADWPFDLRIQVLAGAALAISFALFATDFVDARTRFPRYYTLLAALVGALLPVTAWTCLIDYRSTILGVTFLALIIIAASALLLLRDNALGKIRLAVAVIAIFVITRTVVMGVSLTADLDTDTLFIRHIWVFLLTCVPAALIGLAVHKQRMQMQLQVSQAESASRVAFLAHMSHELRTPLDVIIGTAQLLSRPSHRARLREGLADISANGRQLLKMIDEVLDYSRGLIGRLSLAPEPVSWPDFLRGVQHNAEILAARNGNAATLTVDGERLEAVCLDERRLRQVLDNLIANAARHTRNGRIALACTIGPAQPDSRRMLAFSVTDTGEGIRPEDIERIFQPFERGSNSVRHGGKGAGMGLAISRQIIELMGGKLTAESTPGEGACFRFGMFVDPADMADAKAPALERLGGYAGAPRTILIADDEPGNRAILAAMLRDSGFIVIEAESGRAAAAEAARAPVDAVLTDQFMADGDGWHVLREIAQQRRGVPVVLISAAPPERPDGFPAEIAFAGHLLKPLDHSDVLRCLGNLLGLDWIETEAANPAPETPLQRPGNAALRDLRELVDAGRISDIVVWAENLKARNEACAPFADQVRDAARDLDFAALANLATRETAAGAET